MPTRFSFSASSEKLKRQLGITAKQSVQQSFNIAANNNAYILKATQAPLEIYRWGLIPHWAKETKVGANLTTAQAEGIASKLSFRLPIRQRRCLVLADSYYEWKKEGRASQPYRIHPQSGDLMTFAGVWDHWEDNNGKLYKTFSIITTPSNDLLQELGRPRMPVVLTTAAARQAWLAAETPLTTILDLLQAVETNFLTYYPVDKAVDVVENNYPELHKAVSLD